MRRVFNILVCLALVPVSALAAGGDIDDLVKHLEALRAEHEVPAFALTLVDRDKTLWSGARGIADLATERPVDSRTRFRIGSISKMFAGMAALLAEQDEALRLDDRVRDFAPQPPFKNRWPDTHPIRVAHLLEHTAGFQDWTRDEWDLNDPLALEDALAYRPASRETRWPAGMHSSYSNAGPGVAALVIERATGQEYQRFLVDRVFRPLRMSTASFDLDSEARRLLATGYDSDGTTPIPYWHVIFRASAGITLNPSDMAPVIRLLINRGRLNGERLLSEAMVTRLEHPETTLAAEAGLEYGYGLGIYQWQREGHSLFGHGGDGDGYLAHFGYSLEAGRGYFIVINAFDHRALKRMRAMVERHLVRDLPEPAMAKSTVASSSLTRLEGRYRQVTVRFPWEKRGPDLEISAERGMLFTRKPGDEPRALVPVTDRFFRRPENSVATTAFIEVTGKMYLQGPMGNYARVLREEERP